MQHEHVNEKAALESRYKRIASTCAKSEADLSPRIEKELRPKIEGELRPIIEEELRLKLEPELKINIIDEMPLKILQKCIEDKLEREGEPDESYISVEFLQNLISDESSPLPERPLMWTQKTVDTVRDIFRMNRQETLDEKLADFVDLKAEEELHRSEEGFKGELLAEPGVVAMKVSDLVHKKLKWDFPMESEAANFNTEDEKFHDAVDLIVSSCRQEVESLQRARELEVEEVRQRGLHESRETLKVVTEKAEEKTKLALQEHEVIFRILLIILPIFVDCSNTTSRFVTL